MVTKLGGWKRSMAYGDERENLPLPLGEGRGEGACRVSLRQTLRAWIGRTRVCGAPRSRVAIGAYRRLIREFATEDRGVPAWV